LAFAVVYSLREAVRVPLKRPEIQSNGLSDIFWLQIKRLNSSDKTAKSKDKSVVYELSRASRCFSCDAKLVIGELAKLVKSDDDREVLCRKCGGFDAFEMLRSGNAKITRLASQLSKTKYVVLKWSQLWKSYERVGLLLEPSAIRQAEEQCKAPE
jgi:hypothetical protein